MPRNARSAATPRLRRLSLLDGSPTLLATLSSLEADDIEHVVDGQAHLGEKLFQRDDRRAKDALTGVLVIAGIEHHRGPILVEQRLEIHAFQNQIAFSAASCLERDFRQQEDLLTGAAEVWGVAVTY